MTDELTAITDEDTPSRRRSLLMAIRSSRVVRMTRYSWSPKQTVASEPNVRPELVFSRASGPLLITLESGLVIGVASQPALISVTLWLDQPPGTAADPELHSIEADDPQFSRPGFAQMFCKPVIGVGILTRDPDHVNWQDRPREAGVRITFERAPELILSHGLHDNSDDFSVLLREDVDASLWPRLHDACVG